jgi:hypothetical protein
MISADGDAANRELRPPPFANPNRRTRTRPISNFQFLTPKRQKPEQGDTAWNLEVGGWELSRLLSC